MSATPQDVQAKIDAAVAALELTTVGYRNKNWKTPPAGSEWAIALADIAAARAEAGQLVAPPPPPPAPTPTPTTGYRYDTIVPTLTYPAFTPARHIVCTTKAAHDTALAAIQPGDWIDCQSILFPGEITYNAALSSLAKVTFDAACQFTGLPLPASPAPSNVLPAIWVKNCANLQLIFNGTPISNPGGNGIIVSGAANCVIDGFRITSAGANGISALPTYADIQGCFIRGEIQAIAQTLAFDPHTEKGTGLHCMIAADSDTKAFHHNTVALYGHDCPHGGSVLQIGDNTIQPHNNTLYVKARNMTQNAASQVAGNAITAWGVPQAAQDVKILELYGCAGRGIDTNGMYGSPAGFTVEYGRADKSATNPYLTPYPGQPWDPRFGVVYQDVATNTGILS